LSQGSIITGLMWGSMVALVIDGKFSNAGWFAVVAAALTSVGILHSSSLQMPVLSEITIGYLMIGVVLIVFPRFAKTESVVSK
jgi:AGZA family xanthine/uracil permease-like MFS transporter